MKFQVTRTSIYEWTFSRENKGKQPCPEAKEEKNAIFKEADYPSAPANIEKRDIWTVEINTLADLLNFTRKYQDIIITERKLTSNGIYEGFPFVIEIYDENRE